VDVFVEAFQCVDVGDKECRQRRILLGPCCLPTSRVSFENKNPVSISVESKACQRLTHLSGNHSVLRDGKAVISTSSPVPNSVVVADALADTVIEPFVALGECFDHFTRR